MLHFRQHCPASPTVRILETVLYFSPRGHTLVTKHPHIDCPLPLVLKPCRHPPNPPTYPPITPRAPGFFSNRLLSDGDRNRLLLQTGWHGWFRGCAQRAMSTRLFLLRSRVAGPRKDVQPGVIEITHAAEVSDKDDRIDS